MLSRSTGRGTPSAGVLSSFARVIKAQPASAHAVHAIARVARIIRGGFIAVLTGLAVSQAVAATLSPEVEKGLAWLQAQVQADGSLAGEDISIAHPYQCRTEAALTLAKLATVPASLQAAVDANTDTTTEFLARQGIADGAAGIGAVPAISTMLGSQNQNGGLGGAAGYESTSLDTALSLLALKSQQPFTSSANPAATALGYLAQARVSGGWGVQDQPRVFVTALVLLAAQEWHTTYAVGSITVAARDWLLASRTNGSFGNVLDDALGLLALATQTTDPAAIQPLSSALLAAQGADGSWNGDPYLTALALRALWSVQETPPASTTAGLTGTVLDAATGAPIADAAIQLLELPDVSTVTGADGVFALSGLTPGSYTLRVARVGYETATTTVALAAGQITTLGTLRLTAAILTATLTGTVKNQGGVALQGVLIAVGTASALTDATGKYVLAGIPPGAATIMANLVGYNPVTSAAVAFAAGQVYSFSPTLYTTAPTATILRGKVVASATGGPIAGATVTLGATNVTTAADGSFSFSGVSAGTFTLTVAAPGYTGMSASGVMVAGINDVGAIALTNALTTSSLAGRVLDVQTGDAIAGATVTVQSQSATSAADGSYSLGGIPSQSFDLVVSAPGYLALTQHVALPQPGAVTLDVKLTKLQPSGITIDSATPSKASYLPTEVLQLDVIVRNTTGQAADVTVDALVLDAANSVVLELKANVHGLGSNPPNLPLTVPAGNTLGVDLHQLLLRQAAGTYAVLVRAYDITGRAVAESHTSFAVTAQPVLGGGLIVDPPLSQAGTQTPIRFNGQLSNLGNEAVAAGDATLTVTLDYPDTQTATQARAEARLIAAGTPLQQLRGLARDAAGNLYSVSNAAYDGRVFKIAPDGTTSVAFRLPTTTQPAAYLMDLALDATGTFWLANGWNSVVWRVDSSGTITKIQITGLDTLQGIDVDQQGNVLLTGRKGTELRLLRRDAAGAETVLWANGLSSPIAMAHDASGDMVVTNNTDGTLVKVRPSGEIVPFVSGLNRPVGITQDAAGNFYVATSGDSSIVKVTAAGTKSVYATGLNQPVDLRFDPAGVLFVSCQGDHAIRKVATDGTVSVFARGIASTPGALAYDPAGNLFVANEDGTLRRLDPAGQASELATGLSTPRGLAVTASGDILVTNYAANAITRVAGAGTSTFATGLASPWGMAADSSGSLLVAEYGKNRLAKFDATGALVERITSHFNDPGVVVIDPADHAIVAGSGAVTLIEGGVPRPLFGAAALLAPDPAGGAVYAGTGYDVYRVAYDGTSVKLKTLPFYNQGMAADGSGNLVLADYSGRKIYRLDAAGSLTVLATLSAYPRFLAGDGHGNVYAVLSDNNLWSVAADGSVSLVSALYASPNWYTPTSLSVGADGRPIVVVGAGKVLAIDPVTGVPSVVKSGIYPSGAAIDSTGKLYASYGSTQDVVIYDAAGTETARWTGFTGPKAIAWDGSQYWFASSSNVFTLAPSPGSYPVRRASISLAGLAIGTDGTPLGVNNGSVFRWDGTRFVLSVAPAGAANLESIAVRADGAVTIADRAASRVITLGAGNTIVADYAGIKTPMGLAFDGAGRLYVASNGTRALARFPAGAPDHTVPETFARMSTPSWIAFDGSGGLWATNGATVNHVDSAGTISVVSSSTTLAGLAWNGSAMLGTSTSTSQLYRWDGAQWTSFAAGLSSSEGVRALADGSVVVANRGNGTLVKWQDGMLDVLAGGLNAPHDVDVSPDGQTLYVAGSQGQVSRVGLDGTVRDLNVAGLIGSGAILYGLATDPDGRMAVTTSETVSGSVFEIKISQPVAPPAPGTVVYQATIPLPALPVGDAYVLADFGSWVPLYGGDFSVRVGRGGLAGELASTFHVGSFAQGVLSTSVSRVPPGSQKVPLEMKLTGADFSSVSRVETALVKPTVMGVRPSGMVADRAGNIYVTDANTGTLRKTTPAGTETILLSGYTFLAGLAIDSTEHLYAPANVGGVYKLLRVTTDGQVTVLVQNLGTTAAGVAINSRDEIFVGQPGRLLLVAQDGTVSTYTTAGIPSPVGIAIDGKDHLYVLNGMNLVTQINPDRSATVLYNKGDGIEQPSFEYEGMAMTADCGENLYLTPFRWEKAGQLSTEEHTLVQVIARSGQATPVLDGTKIHYDLYDMDYIAFDRFGSRILLWTDYSGGRIWQVPVTCGAISVDAHVVTKPGQTLTGMNRAPAATVPLANGGTEYVWSLRDVTATGVSVGFDTLLENLVLGESRPVVDSAFLLFQNSFASNDIKVPLPVPAVQVDNLVAMAVGSDQPSYAANTTALLTTRLDNPRTVDAAGVLSVEVLDSAGVVVGQVIQQGATIPAGGTLEVPGGFPIGSIVPGTYTVRATLSDDDRVLAKATATFQVVGDTASGTAVSQLVVDKGSYNATDRATITSRAVSKSANLILDNLTLTVTVTDPAGATVFTKAIAIVQLPVGGTLGFENQYAFVAAPAGTYTVTQVLTDASGTVLDTQTKTYEVVSSAASGFGLGGTIGANPKEVPVGQPVSLALTVANQGNGGYTGLPLTVRVVNPAQDTVLAQFPTVIDLPAGGAYASSLSWPTQGQAGDVLVAALAATVAGKEIALAQDSFMLKGIPIKLDLTQTLERTSRVLVLAACSGHGEGNEHDGHDHDDGHSDRDHTVTSRPGQSSQASCDHDDDGHDDSGDDDHGNDDHDHGPKCGLGRAQAIDALLNGLGIAHRVTTDPAIFRSELRSGAYTTYWISGEVKKLKDDLAEEVREAVNRGDSLLLDGVHDQRNKVLEEAAGVTVRGKLGSQNQPVWLVSPTFDDQLLSTSGRGLRLDLEGGQAVGMFGSPTGRPAVVSHTYGQGKALFLGLDLVASLVADARWPAESGLGLAGLLPPLPTTLTPGAYVPLALTVTNTGQDAAVEVRTTLPAGATFLAADPAPASQAGPVVWSLPLTAGAQQVLHLAVRAPMTEGTHTVSTEIGTVVGGTFAPYGTPHTLDLTVVAASSQLPAVQAQIAALAVTKRDREARDKAAEEVSQAVRAITASRFADAIEALIDAIGWLTRIETADTTAPRLALDQALKEVEWRWAQAQ